MVKSLYSLFGLTLILSVPVSAQNIFSDPIIVSTSASGGCGVFAADLDHDNDLDILSASSGDNKIAWYENTDGKGTFSDQKVITTSANWAIDVYAADLDNDGDFDVLSASADDNKIAWYENTDGKGAFGNQKTITTSADGAIAVYAVDLDDDNDFDVISASKDDDKIAWYLNLSREMSVEENESEAPKDFCLYQNYPNPFNPTTNIRFALSDPGHVALKIFDLSGREIRTLLDTNKDAGVHEIKWTSEGLPSGIYFCRLQTENYSGTKKLIVQR